MNNKAVLLVNLGSPKEPTTPEVRRYLHQFLMDPDVIQLPWLLRKIIVCLFVLPFRPKASAQAYQSIWLPEGSPLIVFSMRLLQKLQALTAVKVEMAMRYGSPDIESKILVLSKEENLKDILLIPLYPHYAESTIKTSIAEAERVIKKHKLDITLSLKQAFYDQPDYINALVSSAEPYLDRLGLEKTYDHLLFSYHGLPEVHITKLDESKKLCLKSADCCQQESPFNKQCYRRQVFKTTARFVEQANLPADKYSIAFQSRLGRARWLAPNTEDRLQELASAGVKNVLVICPAFVSDCLETLEEIAIRGEEVFKQAGGESLTLVPCLNDHPAWLDVLKHWSEEGGVTDAVAC